MFVSVSSSLWRKGPCITTLLGSWPWPSLKRVWTPTESVLRVLRMLATGPWLCPQLSRLPPLGSPALSGRVTQAEIRAGRKPLSWAIYGHTLRPLGPHPQLGTGQLICEIQAPFLAPAGLLFIYSMFLWERRRTQFRDSSVSRGSNNFSGFQVDKCSFAEHIA